MRVLLVADYVPDHLESMRRFVLLMNEGLTSAGHEVKILRPAVRLGKLRLQSEGFGKWLGYLDKFIFFPKTLKRELAWADIVHICDHSNAHYVRYLKQPHVVTCHDLLAIRSALGEIPQNRTGWTGRFYQRLILRGLVRSDHISCDSEATRKDLLRIAGIKETDVSRIYIGLNYPYSPMQPTESTGHLKTLQLDPNQAFILHVGGNQWYKNRLGVLRIFHLLNKGSKLGGFKLIMVGKPWTETMRKFITEHALEDKVLELTDVSEEALRALYSTAALLLFPSLCEGFGWPILEAQACGCPVATSDRHPMREVAGTAALFIDPEAVENAATTIAEGFSRLAELREPSMINAKRFSSDTMIAAYLKLYGQLISMTPSM
jgi:glycosyltransferase involved in cell wall biosynthesis